LIPPLIKLIQPDFSNEGGIDLAKMVMLASKNNTAKKFVLLILDLMAGMSSKINSKINIRAEIKEDRSRAKRISSVRSANRGENADINKKIIWTSIDQHRIGMMRASMLFSFMPSY